MLLTFLFEQKKIKIHHYNFTIRMDNRYQNLWLVEKVLA